MNALARQIRSGIAQNRNWCLVRVFIRNSNTGLFSVLPRSDLYRLHHVDDFVRVAATPRSERWDDIAATFDAFIFLGEIPYVPHRLVTHSYPTSLRSFRRLQYCGSGSEHCTRWALPLVDRQRLLCRWGTLYVAKSRFVFASANYAAYSLGTCIHCFWNSYMQLLLSSSAKEPMGLYMPGASHKLCPWQCEYISPILSLKMATAIYASFTGLKEA